MKGGIGAAARMARTVERDHWLTGLASVAGLERIGGALVAVGSYGRGELAPQSDLDVLLLHPNSAAPEVVADVANAIWYPIWDAGIALDHSVRTLPEARRMAAADAKVMLGLLDARCIAGDVVLVEQVRSAILADWRGTAKHRLAELRESVIQRTQRAGEMAHLLEPDLKESFGGLRDITLLRAVAASWITDFPHESVEQAATTLLDVRVALHLATKRPGDRLLMQEQAAVADALGLVDDDAVLRLVSDAGRAVAYAADITWQRVERLTRPTSPIRRLSMRPDRTPLADGVVAQFDEVFLARDARPDRDPVLTLRAAAAAAQAGLRLAPETVQRLAAESAALPTPWPRGAREALVSLLGSGASAVPVWEALDHVGLMTRMLPHWRVVRSAPQRNALHIYTVDRHQLECAARAASSARAVERPDLLLIAALFHDIGKSRGPNHSAIGYELMRDIAPRLGFDEADSDVLCRLVRHHLLLVEYATRRDIDDPVTIRRVVDAVGSREVLELLHHLTRADSLATGPGNWNDWKAGLVEALVARAHAALVGRPPRLTGDLAVTHPELIASAETMLRVTPEADGLRITVATDDRPGLLATVAGAMALQRLDVRAAQVQTIGDRALQSWIVTPEFGEAPAIEAVREGLLRAISGSLEVSARLARRIAASRPPRRGFVPPAPVVRFLAGESERAEVLEVRAHDAPALLWRLAGAIADVDVMITNARVETLGSEVIDVLYLVRTNGEALSAEDRRAVEDRVLTALHSTA